MQKGLSFGLVVGEDQKYVLNTLHVALPKEQMGLIFWVAVVGDSLIFWVLLFNRLGGVFWFIRKYKIVHTPARGPEYVANV